MDSLYGRNKEEHPEPIKAEVQGKWKKNLLENEAAISVFWDSSSPAQHWKGKLKREAQGNFV